MVALGDTADPAAFPVLLGVVGSGNWRLRVEGADLTHLRAEAGAAAAHALVAAGHTEVVERAGDPPEDRAAAFDAALRGEAPPLAPLCDGGAL